MEKFEKTIENETYVLGHTYANLDEEGKVELCWIIRNNKGCQITIFLKRFEILVTHGGKKLEQTIPLDEQYQNRYVLIGGDESAKKAAEVAHSLITALRKITHTAVRL